MATLDLPTYVTPTEAVSYYNLFLIGAIGGLGVIALSELVKNKSTVPVQEISKWTIIFGIAAALSIYGIDHASQ